MSLNRSFTELELPQLENLLQKTEWEFNKTITFTGQKNIQDERIFNKLLMGLKRAPDLFYLALGENFKNNDYSSTHKYLSASQITTLIGTLTDFKKLRSLRLQGNFFDQTSLLALEKLIRNNHQLTELYLIGNVFPANTLTILTKIIEENIHLESLDLSANPLLFVENSENSVLDFFTALVKSGIKTLWLHANKIPSVFLPALITLIKKRPDLNLYIGYEAIACIDFFIDEISKSLMNNDKITALNLPASNINDEHAIKLCKAVLKNNFLQTLNLPKNNITNASFKYFEKLVKKNIRLIYLRLNSTGIDENNINLLKSMTEDNIKKLRDLGKKEEVKKQKLVTSLFFSGVKTKDIDVVKLAIAAKADVRKTDFSGNTALHLAVELDDHGIAELLLNTCEDPILYENHSQHTPITLIKSSKMADLFYERYSKLQKGDFESDETYKILNSTSFKIQKVFANHLLRDATKWGNKKIANLALEHGAEINKKNNHGETSIFVAVYNQYVELAIFLAEKGADPSIKDKVGQTAYERADDELAMKIAKEYLFYSIQKHCDEEIISTLNEIQSYIKSKNGEFNKFISQLRSADDKTLLHYLALYATETIVRLFLEKFNFLDSEAIDKKNYTALHYLAERGEEKILSLFLLNFKEINLSAKDHLGQIALHKAMQNTNKEIISILFEEHGKRGLNTNVADFSGLTPFDIDSNEPKLEKTALERFSKLSTTAHKASFKLVDQNQNLIDISHLLRHGLTNEMNKHGHQKKNDAFNKKELALNK